jgi:polysaccharide biosynthesis/export protein
MMKSMKTAMLVGLSLLVCLAASELFAGAFPLPQQAEPAATKEGAASNHRPATTDKNYVIGADDVLDVNVWKEPDVTRSVPVRPDGKISLPLLNDVQAAGLTPTQLAADITEKLRKYITDPQVTVIVTAVNSQRIFVLGEVNRPGPLMLFPNMTVIQAIASAGSFTQFANEKKIYVLRKEGSKEKRYPFNYKEAIRGEMQQNIVLKPGDTIVVP